MGIFLDTVEDNRERGWETEYNYYTNLQKRREEHFKQLEICPKCRDRFFSEQELQDHIFYKHRHNLVFTSVDGLISQKDLAISSYDLKKANNTYEALQKEFVQKDSLSLDTLNAIVQQKRDNPMLSQYYRGLLEYLEVAHFEKNSNRSDIKSILRRLEHVYGYLQPFQSRLARQIRCAIAFRFNWFNALKKSHAKSIFYLAHIFFTRQFEDIQSVSLPIEGYPREKLGIYLEERSESILEMVTLFFNERINKDRFQQLKDKVAIEENYCPIFSRKMDIISARTYRKLNCHEEAKQIYQALTHDPEFSIEARYYRHGK